MSRKSEVTLRAVNHLCQAGQAVNCREFTAGRCSQQETRSLAWPGARTAGHREDSRATGTLTPSQAPSRFILERVPPFASAIARGKCMNRAALGLARSHQIRPGQSQVVAGGNAFCSWL